jgi:hypothetical protein
MSIDPKSGDFDIKVGRDATGFYILSEKGDYAEKEVARLKKSIDLSHIPRDLATEKALREVAEFYKVIKTALSEYKKYLTAYEIVEISAKKPLVGKPNGNIFLTDGKDFSIDPTVYSEIERQNIIASYKIVNEYARINKI